MIQISSTGQIFLIEQNGDSDMYPIAGIRTEYKTNIVIRYEDIILLTIRDRSKVSIPISVSMADLAQKINDLIN